MRTIPGAVLVLALMLSGAGAATAEENHCTTEAGAEGRVIIVTPAADAEAHAEAETVLCVEDDSWLSAWLRGGGSGGLEATGNEGTYVGGFAEVLLVSRR